MVDTCGMFPITLRIMQQFASHPQRAVIVALIVFAITIPCIANGDNYLWPLPASRELTSGFCQWRSGHWHSGIDIRTFGKTGYKVSAIAGGHVWRVRTGWRGYGKSLYLKLDDGRIAVYAHLEKFTPEIDRYVQEQQLAQRRYQVDLYPLEGRFRFKAGETVAVSGKSGGAAPHLHFEIRARDENPLSPLTFYPDLVDDLSPVIRKISFRSLSPTQSRVDGHTGVTEVPLLRGKGNLTSSDTCTVYGPVGVEIDCVDKRSNTSRSYAVSRIEMFVDSYETALFVTNYDTLSFDRWGEVNLELNYTRSLKGDNFVHNLYQFSGTNPPLVNDHTWNKGWIEAGASENGIGIGPGVHTLLFRVYDQSGNVSRASVIIDLRCPPAFDGHSEVAGSLCSDHSNVVRHEVALLDQATGTFAPYLPGENASAFGDYIDGDINLLAQFRDLTQRLVLYSIFTDDGARFDHLVRVSETGVPIPAPTAGLGADVLSPSRLESRYDPLQLDTRKLADFWDAKSRTARSVCFVLPVMFDTADSLVLVDPSEISIPETFFGQYGTPIVAGGNGSSAHNVKFPGAEFILEKGDLLGASAVRVDTATISVTDYGMAKAIILGPADLLLNDWIDIGVPSVECESAARCHLYSVTEDGGVSFVSSSLDSNSVLHAKVSRLVSYAVLSDTVGPRIWQVTPGDGGRVNSSRPKISFKLDDALSGIEDDTSIEITVDGIWAIPEYDTASKWMVTYSSQDLDPGNHVLRIHVRDRAGNETAYSSSFRYVKGSGQR